MQCKRCQRFSHAATNCKLDYRCVKCNENHGPGDCGITKSIDNQEQLFCILCKAKGHPASYKGCPEYSRLKNAMKNKNKMLQEKSKVNLKYINNYTSPNKSFAQLFSNENESKVNKIQNIQKSEFTEIKNSLDMICNKFTSLEKSTKINSERIEFLFDLINNGNN